MTFRHNTDIGQNFLIDKSVSEWMTARAGLGPCDRVLEIGPGSGILTKGILESGCAGLDAIEIDTRLKEYLEPIAASDSRLALHWGDAVRFDYAALARSPTHVIANLPYHITTPVLWKLLEAAAGNLSYMLVMTQAEAAERLSCGAGARESNPLSITLSAMGSAIVARKVSRTAFRPAPRVDSAIVEIRFAEPDGRRGLPNGKIWRRLLSGSFAARRKTLVNNWKASFGMTRELALETLAKHSLGGMSRPEELSLGDWLALSRDENMAGHIT